MQKGPIHVLIPAYNEDSVILETLKPLMEAGYQLIVVDDGSQDDTFGKLKDLPIHLIRHKVNLGQGAALQTGMTYAQEIDAKILVHFDADGQHRVEDIPVLIAPILSNEVDVVLGSRFLGGKSFSLPWTRRLLLKTAVIVNGLLTGMWLSDAHNGLRAFNATALSKIELKENGMAHATEILSEIRNNQLRFREVPVQISYSAYSLAKGQSNWHALQILSDLLLRKFFSQ